eukprot:gnl/MRDRNA2_/MRDRNA2_28203_c0_seq1.p1 gnl/MRDRNA2_/MRDRNA2_28203_c0~~gnl/MRDRNA2_/MRDRNA2_28203_c0_seq1.p1  ORF type:complete len:409 (-),score=84.14 gnl/MRDRNA2_/MRDRNA2_28203_c0_seq1:156-1301(-)
MCDDTGKKAFTLSGAVVVFLAGVGITIVAGMALNSKNLVDADSMINANTQNGDGISVDMTKVCTGALVFGILAIIASIFGCLGVSENNKLLLCGYIVAALIFAVFFLTCGTTLFMMFESVEPTVERQVAEFCDQENYAQLTTQLSCPAPTEATTRRLADECNAACDDRLKRVQKMGGCKFLMHACTRKEYANVGDGFCTLPDGTRPPMYGSAPLTPVDLESCQKYCDVDIDCTGIVHQYGDQPVCFVITKDGNTPAGNGWILQKQSSDATLPLQASDGSAGAVCQAKDVSLLVARLKSYGVGICIATLCIGSFLLISICSTFAHMYMVNTKRKGRKGFPALCASMFCPCCRTKEKKNMLRNYEDEDGDEEELTERSDEGYE